MPSPLSKDLHTVLMSLGMQYFLEIHLLLLSRVPQEPPVNCRLGHTLKESQLTTGHTFKVLDLYCQEWHYSCVV